MKTRELVIVGAGGHGKVILDILLSLGRKVAGFVDDDKTKHGQTIHGYAVLGGLAYLDGKPGLAAVLGIGSNRVRRKLFEALKAKGVAIEQAIHPRAVVSATASLGEGVTVMAGAVINIDAKVGDGVVVNTGASVDHDCELAAFCQIYPGAHLAGTVLVGEESYVGTGAAVIQNIRIGSKVMVGAGAAVISDIEDGVTVVGVPAKRKI